MAVITTGARLHLLLALLVALLMAKVGAVAEECECDPLGRASQLISCHVGSHGVMQTTMSRLAPSHLQFECAHHKGGETCQCCDCGIAESEGRNKGSNVIILREDNFELMLEYYGVLLVHYYTPWCERCPQVAIEFEAAATELMTTMPTLRLAKVDVTQQPSLAGRASVDDTWTSVWASTKPVAADPTIKLYKLGRVAEPEFTGEPTRSGIVEWVTQRTAHPCRFLRSVADARAMLAAPEIKVIGFFSPADVTSSLRSLTLCRAALEFPTFHFAITTVPEVAAHFNWSMHFAPNSRAMTGDLVETSAAVILLRNWGQRRVNLVLPEILDNENLLCEQIISHAVIKLPPLISEWKESGSADDRRITENPIKLHLLVFADKTATYFPSLIQDLGQVAEIYENP